jgi:hypothetical protein
LLKNSILQLLLGAPRFSVCVRNLSRKNTVVLQPSKPSVAGVPIKPGFSLMGWGAALQCVREKLISKKYGGIATIEHPALEGRATLAPRFSAG